MTQEGEVFGIFHSDVMTYLGSVTPSRVRGEQRRIQMHVFAKH